MNLKNTIRAVVRMMCIPGPVSSGLATNLNTIYSFSYNFNSKTIKINKIISLSKKNKVLSHHFNGKKVTIFEITIKLEKKSEKRVPINCNYVYYIYIYYN